jgi:nucleotide-binding universal stress UspA family protein
MMRNVLLAVDDSPAGLAAAQLAVRLVSEWAGQLRAVHVLFDGALEAVLERESSSSGVHGRRARGANAVLEYVADLADEAGVPVETRLVAGEAARSILAEAHDWQAELIVLGGAGRALSGEPYMGSAVRQVLEFADVPVLVVPPD